MHHGAYNGVFILIVGFIIINYVSKEFIFEKKMLNEISENKFFSKVTRYTVHGDDSMMLLIVEFKNFMGIPLERLIFWFIE